MRARPAMWPCLGLALALLLGGAPAGAQSISTLAAQAEAERAGTATEPQSAPAATQGPVAAKGVELTLPVPNVTLYPGDALNAAVLTARPAPQHVVESGTYATRTENLAGKVARRVLIAGMPIPMSAVTDALMVTKGVAARVLLKEGGLQISGYAIPLESGAAGSIVRLKNMDSGQIIVGEVQADGTVRIKMR